MFWWLISIQINYYCMFTYTPPAISDFIFMQVLSKSTEFLFEELTRDMLSQRTRKFRLQVLIAPKLMIHFLPERHLTTVRTICLPLERPSLLLHPPLEKLYRHRLILRSRKTWKVSRCLRRTWKPYFRWAKETSHIYWSSNCCWSWNLDVDC